MDLTQIKYLGDEGIKQIGKAIPKIWSGTKAEWEQFDKSTLADGAIVNITDDYNEKPIQVKTMPTDASEGDVVQYIGATDSDYTNGYFYKNVADETGILSWKNIPVMQVETPENKEVLDKFSENDEGKILYDNKPLASDNLWTGTKAEYDAIVDKDPNKTYVVTDEEPTLADYILDDTTTSPDKTWSSEKIKNEFTSLDDNRIVDLSSVVTVNTDIAAGDPIIHICRKGFTVYLRIEFTYIGNATIKTTTLISGLPQKYTPSVRIISPLVAGFSPTNSTMYGSRLWIEADGTVKISETDMVKDTNARFAFTYLVI